MGPRRGKLVAEREAHAHVHIAAQREAQYANIQEIRLNVWLAQQERSEGSWQGRVETRLPRENRLGVAGVLPPHLQLSRPPCFLTLVALCHLQV